MRRPDDPEIRPGIARLFRLAVHRPERARAEADDEIRLHLELRAEQLRREGLTPEAAQAEAERRFGSVDEARSRFHDSTVRRQDRMRTRESFEAIAQDLRVSVRGLRRSPAFTVTAVLCLALGIGANAATFSLFDELLLRPLPVHEPERLVNIEGPGPRSGRDSWTSEGPTEALFNYPIYRDLSRAQRVFTGIAAHREMWANFAYRDRTLFGQGLLVSGSYFPILGLRPALGRLLGPGDDETIGGHPVAVLSHAYWITELGADSAVLGKTLVVNGHGLTVVGVAPPGFEGTAVGSKPRVFAPLAMAAELDPGIGGRSSFEDRQWYWVYMFARLAPGVTIEQARRGMNAIYSPILSDVEAPLQTTMSAQTLARFRQRTLSIEDGRRGQSILQGQTRQPLILLFGITGLVVLIACANVANLLLARGATRASEIAVRLSLGAGRRRLLAQLLTESLLLATLGGLASIVVAGGTLSLIASLIPHSDIGIGTSLALELRTPALIFAAIVSLGTGLLFGLIPALQSTRSDLVTAIRASSGQPSGARAAVRFRTSLVMAQIALSMALLIAAGLFIRSLSNVERVDLGMDADHVATFGLAPELSGYEPARTRALFARLEQSLASVPGVTGVAASSVPLFTGSTNGANVRVEGFRRDPDTDANTRVNRVGPNFIRTMRIPLIAGREFTDADRLGAPKVAIVNEAFAKKFGLGKNPVGRRAAVDWEGTGTGLDIEIVGLVRDTRYSGVKANNPPLFMEPYLQDSLVGASFFYARTTLRPEALLRTIRETMGRIDPALPVMGLRTFREQVRESVYLDRMIGTLSAAFAALATLLAAVGLNGVLAYTVAQRRREIGVRMALGASGGRVRGMVLAQVARMTLVGGIVGIAAALAMGRAAESLLFQLNGHDPMVVGLAAALLTVVALAAGYVPAWKASRMDPMQALRVD